MVPKIAAALKELDADTGEFILQKTPRVRYQMWNGQWHAAVKRMHEIYNAAKKALNVEPATQTERLQRFRRQRASLPRLFPTGPKLIAHLDPDEFIRVHRSHAVRVSFIAELHPMFSGD
jgi:hypothetical protein